jgi:hypothetical protein
LQELSDRLKARLRGLEGRQAAAWLALALVLAAAFWLRLTVIDKSMPYPQHVDETFLSDNGANMLRSGDFNPHFFMYPGLPIYLTAAAMTWGYLDAANHLELKSTREIGSVNYPYYKHPRLVRPARVLFALISVAGMLMLALLARRLGDGGIGGLAAMVLAPAWLALSPLYFEQSQAYLNVNIVGSALAWTTLWLVVKNFERPGLAAKVLLPGIFCGLVIASKYNFAAILLAPLLAIFWRGAAPLRQAILLFGVAGATFLCCAPYTLLDFSAFLDDLGKITYVYRGGEFGSRESASFGGHLLLNLTEMHREFGAASGLFVLIGTVVLARRDWRRLLLVAVFPLLLFYSMTASPTHLMRNLVPFLPLWALCAATGAVAAWRFLAAWLAARRPAWSARWRTAAALLAILAPLAFFLPLGAPREFLAKRYGSRQEATAWLLENAPKDRPLLVARELGLHPAPFRKAGLLLKELPLRSLSAEELRAELAENPEALVLLPRTHAYHWDPEVLAAGRELLPKFESFLQEVEPVREFGSELVSVTFEYPPGGDPKILIGRPRRH